VSVACLLDGRPRRRRNKSDARATPSRTGSRRPDEAAGAQPHTHCTWPALNMKQKPLWQGSLAPKQPPTGPVPGQEGTGAQAAGGVTQCGGAGVQAPASGTKGPPQQGTTHTSPGKQMVVPQVVPASGRG